MTFEEAKKIYEENGGHYFEWMPVFNQELKSGLFEPQRTFILGIYFKNTKRYVYSVLGFNKNFTKTMGFGKRSGYISYEEAVRVAKNPGKQLW